MAEDTWLITFNHTSSSTDELDAICLELVESGALGTHTINDDSIGVFIAGSQNDAELFASGNCVHPLTSYSLAHVEEKNWVQECKDLHAPHTSGIFTVIPIMRSEELPPKPHPANTLYIIPGLGFGTGHHETTSSILGLLSHTFLQNLKPHQILDVGTGSGILAIASAMQFKCRIDACDNDPLAVDNAIENISINGLSSFIRCSTNTIEAFSDSYDLIIANIYAEILAEIEHHIRARLSSGKALIISGIMLSRVGLINQAYETNSWNLIEEIIENNWVTRLYERR